MAMTKAYYSVNGRILGEASGGTRLDYMTDALGSVTGTVDSSAQAVNTYRYKPYGGLLAKTGGGSDPKFAWNGGWGYRTTGARFADIASVSPEHYSTILGLDTSKPSPSLSTTYQYFVGLLHPVPLTKAEGKCLDKNCCCKATDLFGCKTPETYDDAVHPAPHRRPLLFSGRVWFLIPCLDYIEDAEGMERDCRMDWREYKEVKRFDRKGGKLIERSTIPRRSTFGESPPNWQEEQWNKHPRPCPGAY